MPKAFDHNDAYTLNAQHMGYRARSAFKLEEILTKYPKILPKNPQAEEGRGGRKVLDLGCAPGSWLQVLKKQEPYQLIGVDVQEIEPLKGVKLIRGDIFSSDIHDQLETLGPFHLITSDMAPKTTGRPDSDQWHSVELNQQVLDLCDSGLLKTGGNLICKIFMGADFQEFWLEFRKSFKDAKCFKPKSCRERSVETFMIGMGFL